MALLRVQRVAEKRAAKAGSDEEGEEGGDDGNDDSASAPNAPRVAEGGSNRRGGGVGRPTNASWKLTNSQFELKLMSKPALPRFSRSLPRHPGAKTDKKSWRGNADTWARAMVATFLPWKLCENLVNGGPTFVRPQTWDVEDAYDWLQTWIRRTVPGGINSVDPWTTPSSPQAYSDLGRISLIRNASFVGAVPRVHRVMLSDYRRRVADELVNDGGTKRKKAGDEDGDDANALHHSALNDYAAIMTTDLDRQTDATKRVDAAAALLAECTPTFESLVGAGHLVPEREPVRRFTTKQLEALSSEIDQAAARPSADLQAGPHHRDAKGRTGRKQAPMPAPGSGGPSVAVSPVPEAALLAAIDPLLTEGQRRFTRKVADAVASGEPALLVLHGPPGSGKTFTMNKLRISTAKRWCAPRTRASRRRCFATPAAAPARPSTARSR